MWRYVKICLYRRLLEQRDAISVDLPNILPSDQISATSRTFQDITNGLIGAAAAELCQYAEDLAVICQALASGEYFAKNLTQFSAGRIQNCVKSWCDISETEARDLLFIPEVDQDPPWPNPDCQRGYQEGIAEVRDCLRGISVLYHQWFQHHIRYKHGMLLALAPYTSQIDDPAFIERRRTSDRGYPVVFDAACVADLVTRSDFHQFLCVPSIGCDDLKWNALKLSREGNLLRYVMPPVRDNCEPSLQDLENSAYRIGQLQRVVLFNYIENRNPDRQDNEWRCAFPRGRKLFEMASAGRVRPD